MFLKYAKAKCESEMQKYVKLKKNKKQTTLVVLQRINGPF